VLLPLLGLLPQPLAEGVDVGLDLLGEREVHLVVAAGESFLGGREFLEGAVELLPLLGALLLVGDLAEAVLDGVGEQVDSALRFPF
jgi:hypothetical protein